jgi:hypothetical protein
VNDDPILLPSDRIRCSKVLILLEDNEMSDNGAAALVEALQQNYYLQVLNVGKNDLYALCTISFDCVLILAHHMIRS